jgi:trimethylamine--corrinoid protein Co-methyltransferase
MRYKEKKMADTNQREKDTKGFCFPRLSEEQCRRIYEASLEILERVGVRLYLDEAVQLLKRAGARVTDGNLVHVSSNIVEKAIKTAPKEVVLYDRQGRPAMPVGGYRCFYGPGSDCLNIIDHRSGERRKPVVKDVEEGAVLCDALPHIDYVMSMVLPSDVDGTVADRFQMEAMLSYTTKPIIYVTYETEGCRDAVEMAQTVMGGAEALKKSPLIACYINAVSGLRHNKDALEKLLFLASENLPSLYIPASTAAITSPVTPAGSVALDYAGVLVGLTLSQLKHEGAPVIVPGMPAGGTFDMKTFVTSYCEPERTITQALGHHLGFPTFAIAGASESKTVDSQAAAEAALGLVVETLAGGNIIHDLGYLESGLTYSFVQLVLCDEIVSWIKAFTRRFEVNDETLALDVIAELGADGDFLNTDHTLNHFRERWYPTHFERMNYDSWLKKGGKDFVGRAAEAVDQILAGHKTEPLPAKVKEKLREIVLRAK